MAAPPSGALLIFLLSLSVLTCAQLSSDTSSLLEFKKGIADDPTGVVRSTWSPVAWDSSAAADSCPRSWHGVLCDDSGAVVTLALVGLGLSGELKFNTIAGMRALRNISLAGNFFTGRLVPAIGAMTSLQHIDLSGNRFYGPIPEKLIDLWGLVHLDLSRNGFKGGFPAGIRNLQQLRVLDLRSNELWGDVGAILSELRNVEHVDLSRNHFYGGLFMDHNNLSSLGNTARYMNLSFNRLSGRFFSNDSMVVFKSLEILDLGQNQLTGELPSFSSMFNLRIFRAGNNLLSGPIPEDLFGDAMQLMELDLSGNGFTGGILTVGSQTLKILNLSSNSLSGLLPSNLASCTSVDLSKNLLSGDLLAMQNWGYSTLEVIKLSSNDLEGSLPSDLASYQKLSMFDLSLNKLTGPVLPSFFTSSTLTCLNLSGNRFNGSITFQTSHPTEISVLPSFSPLQILDLSNNLLSGELPAEISKLGGLQVFDFSLNGFKGRIPDMPQPDLKTFNVSYNDLSGEVPRTLLKFPMSSFLPGNSLLIFPNHVSFGNNNTVINESMSRHSHSKTGIKIALIAGSTGLVMLIFVLFIAFHKMRSQELCGFSGNVSFGASKKDPSPTSMSFSNDHLLTSTTRSMEFSYSDSKCATAEPLPCIPKMECEPSAGSLSSSSPQFVNPSLSEQPALLEVYSPDRLFGQLFFFDLSRTFTSDELSRAPAEVLGRSSHGMSYKATLDGGHVLTVKWLRAGLAKHKKEFFREAKRIGNSKHPNIASWRGYYWGSKVQERLILLDYICGDSLSFYLHESMPRRYGLLSIRQRLKIAIDIARALHYLHNEKGLPHGNLKPANILLTGPDLTAKLADFGLHRLLTPAGITEQILNLGALGYRAPELATTDKPFPSFKADVYSFGVVLMEMLTRKSAGDIISGQLGSVDLTDWVQMCAREGRGSDCFDRDAAGLEEAPTAMDELLAVSLKCILPVRERPDIHTIFQELGSITM